MPNISYDLNSLGITKKWMVLIPSFDATIWLDLSALTIWFFIVAIEISALVGTSANWSLQLFSVTKCYFKYKKKIVKKSEQNQEEKSPRTTPVSIELKLKLATCILNVTTRSSQKDSNIAVLVGFSRNNLLLHSIKPWETDRSITSFGLSLRFLGFTTEDRYWQQSPLSSTSESAPSFSPAKGTSCQFEASVSVWYAIYLENLSFKIEISGTEYVSPGSRTESNFTYCEGSSCKITTFEY